MDNTTTGARSARSEREGMPLTLHVAPCDLPYFQEMVRQQLLGDLEMMRDILGGREDPEQRWDLGQRIEYVRKLAAFAGLPEDPERRRDPSRAQGGFISPKLPKWRRRLVLWCLR